MWIVTCMASWNTTVDSLPLDLLDFEDIYACMREWKISNIIFHFSNNSDLFVKHYLNTLKKGSEEPFLIPS